MTKKLSTLLLVIVTSSALASCQGNMNKQSTGQVLGGVSGALIGAQFGRGSGQLVGLGLGALAGSFIGGSIGRNLDAQDARLMQATSQNALETAKTGDSIKWQNPDNGHYGYITPVRTVNNEGTVCREYQQKITVGGQTQEGYGTACRQADGSWKIVK